MKSRKSYCPSVLCCCVNYFADCVVVRVGAGAFIPSPQSLFELRPQNVSCVLPFFSLFARNVNTFIGMLVGLLARWLIPCGMITVVRVCFLNCSVKTPKNTFYTSVRPSADNQIWEARPPIAAPPASNINLRV